MNPTALYFELEKEFQENEKEDHIEWLKRLYKPDRWKPTTLQGHIEWLEKYGWDAISMHESVTGKYEEWHP